MTPRRRGGLGLDLAVLVGGWLFVFLLHPPWGFLWGETAWIVYNLGPLPLDLGGLREAIRWQATVHTPARVRPVRAALWWLGAHAAGGDAAVYFVIDALALGVAGWALARLAIALTGSRAAGVVAAGCLAVSYATSYHLLSFVSFAFATAFGVGGLAAWARSEEDGAARRRWQAAALGLLLLAGLAHETMLALALVPLAHALVVRRDRAAAWRALTLVSVLALYGAAGAAMTAAFASGAAAPRAASWRPAAGAVVENAGRVLFTVLTGGLPLDPLRALPWIPRFARLREMAATPAGLATVLAALGPGIWLTLTAVRATARDPEARRRVWFCAIWLGLGTLPLVLPVAAPEAFHVTGALPALFLLWTEALRRPRGRGPIAVAAVVLAVWAGLHGAARWMLFHRDLPAMAAAVTSLHGALARAEAEGGEARVLFFPVQVGGHYGAMPTVAPLYTVRQGSETRCVRGDSVRGCLVEPTWVWSALDRGAPWPPACRDGDAIRVGPVTAAFERDLAGMRRLLAQGGAGWTAGPSAPRRERLRLLDVCPLAAVERRATAGGAVWEYRLPASPGARWYRFTLEPTPGLVPIASCADTVAGKPAP